MHNRPTTGKNNGVLYLFQQVNHRLTPLISLPAFFLWFLVTKKIPMI